MLHDAILAVAVAVAEAVTFVYMMTGLKIEVSRTAEVSFRGRIQENFFPFFAVCGFR